MKEAVAVGVASATLKQPIFMEILFGIKGFVVIVCLINTKIVRLALNLL
jgi:hypothetical protein